MESQFAALHEFEVFDCIGHVDLFRRDSQLIQSAAKDLARGTYERSSFEVFLVARLFANEHECGVVRAVSCDDLSGMTVKIASLAAG